MWRYIGSGASLLGVPTEDISDERFAELSAAFDAREGVTDGIANSGLYEYVEDDTSMPRTRRKREG